MRILSQPKYPNAASPREAIEHLKQSVEQTDHAMWADDVSLLEETAFDASAIMSSRHITDIYLLALAVEHSGRLVTFDRHIPISAVVGAKKEHLVVLTPDDDPEPD